MVVYSGSAKFVNNDVSKEKKRKKKHTGFRRLLLAIVGLRGFCGSSKSGLVLVDCG